jgi:hypothetical protein
MPLVWSRGAFSWLVLRKLPKLTCRPNGPTSGPRGEKPHRLARFLGRPDWSKASRIFVRDPYKKLLRARGSNGSVAVSAGANFTS